MPEENPNPYGIEVHWEGFIKITCACKTEIRLTQPEQIATCPGCGRFYRFVADIQMGERNQNPTLFGGKVP